MGAVSQVKTAVVTGDFTLDWNLVRNPAVDGRQWSMNDDGGTGLSWQRGGAGLLADLVAELANCAGGWKVLEPRAPRRAGTAADAALGPEDARFHHSFAAWQPHDYLADKDKCKNEAPACRVAEFLGGHPAKLLPGEWARVAEDDPAADVVVIDDAGLGFRDRPELWPAALTAESAKPWVVVKVSRPVAQGPLWEHLAERHSGRLIVLMTVNDLRLTDVQITRALSWERTAQDLLWEVAFNKGLASLARCAHVVVNFGGAGAIHLTGNAEGRPKCRLVFDPEVVEGMWEQSIPGRMVGSTSCLSAGLVRELLASSVEPEIASGIKRGLAALRVLHLEGYGERGQAPGAAGMCFPISKVAAALEAGDKRFQQAPVPMRRGDAYWTILGVHYQGGFEEIARKVVLLGPEKALDGVPFGRFGKLLTVDRQEIESLRSIGTLTSEYLAQQKPKQPLSIAVFGPPGSGKSFGITQLALVLKPGEIEKKTFNLSQMQSTRELLSALHQVRDIALQGKTPLVFWDEFDAKFDGAVYGWLRYFLAPMQDGEFQEGDLTHPIGKAIFVFAGGTSPSLEEFGGPLSEPERRAAKMPDFVSRLKGYLNVLGPNQREGVEDPSYILRRAILLRAFLANHKQLLRGKEIQIDEGVLRALLLTRKYKHGARSMESLVAMSQFDGKSKFERSSLPTRAQMDLHVYGQNFLARVHQLEMVGELLETMAEAAHEVYRKGEYEKLRAKGVAENDFVKVNPNLVDYKDLPESTKEQNRGQVRDIPEKLAHASCYLIRAAENEPPFRFPNEMLEELASMEHTRWMRLKSDQDWRWGKEKDPGKRENPCMLAWKQSELTAYAGFEDRLGQEELSEEEKEKDRDAVRNFGQIVALAGYTIVAQQNS